MSIMHFAGMASAATFTLTNVMVAGIQAGVQTGYNNAGLGSLTPNTIHGLICGDIRHLTVSDIFQISINNGVDLGQNFFQHCLFQSSDSNWDGILAVTADASDYNFSGGSMNWNWNAPFSPGEFINGQTYNCEIL